MKAIWAWLKSHLKLVGIGVVLIIAALFVRSCINVNNETALLKGEVRLLQAQNKQVQAKSDKIIAENKKVIAAQDAQISLLTTQVGHANTIIGGLQGDYAALEAAYAAANTCPEKLTLALKQIDNLKGQIVQKDSIILSLNNTITLWGGKYDAQVSISGAWEAKFNSSEVLRLKGEELNSSLQKALGICRITGTIKSGLVVAALVYVGARAIGVLK